MTWVKVCGITTKPAAAAVTASGADACGFVLASGSPRTIGADDAGRLMADIAADKYIVLVDATPDEALRLAEETRADGIQAHGRHALAVAQRALDEGFKALYPVRVSATGVADQIRSLDRRLTPLLDAYHPAKHGGTGSAFDWSLIGDPGRPFVLAGGLGPENVADAVQALRPFGVDASSRLESSPGIKDPSRIIDFVREARSA